MVHPCYIPIFFSLSTSALASLRFFKCFVWPKANSERWKLQSPTRWVIICRKGALEVGCSRLFKMSPKYLDSFKFAGYERPSWFKENVSEKWPARRCMRKNGNEAWETRVWWTMLLMGLPSSTLTKSIWKRKFEGCVPGTQYREVFVLVKTHISQQTIRSHQPELFTPLS